MTGKIVAGLGLLSAAIGHGPSTPDKFSSGIMIALGIVFAVFSLHPGTRLGRRGSGGPIGSAGRLILFIIALVMFTEGVRGLLY